MLQHMLAGATPPTPASLLDIPQVGEPRPPFLHAPSHDDRDDEDEDGQDDDDYLLLPHALYITNSTGWAVPAPWAQA